MEQHITESTYYKDLNSIKDRLLSLENITRTQTEAIAATVDLQFNNTLAVKLLFTLFTEVLEKVSPGAVEEVMRDERIQKILELTKMRELFNLNTDNEEK